jgi:ubiquinone/menaquinone biosynthesis C-methylase UbiE
MLMLANLKPGEVLFDLGSGDGRVLFTAAVEFGAKAVGIELRKDLVERARSKASKLKLGEKVKVIHGNVLDVPISQADVVTLYLTTAANDRVKPKLEEELREGARVVSHDFEVPGWTPKRVERFYENYLSHELFLYIR